MSIEQMFTLALPIVGGFLLVLLIVDLLIGKRDRAARRSRLVLTVIVTLVEGGLILWQVLHTAHPEPWVTQSHSDLIAEPPDDTAYATEARLNRVTVPAYNPGVSIPVLSEKHSLGDRRPFELPGGLVEADLIHVHDPVYAWLAIDAEIDRETLMREVDLWVSVSLPAFHKRFGFPESDAPIHIVHDYSASDGVHGAFLPDAGILYINLAHHGPDKASYQGTAIHALQHMAHWQRDPNEARWMDEGLSELAQRVLGIDPGRSDEVFRENFDTQLNHWPYEGEAERPNASYGASYRFMLYLWEQFGDEMIRDLIRHPINGLASIDAVLEARQTGRLVDEVFADWVLANAVDVGDYRYEHEEWEASLPTMWTETTFSRYPIEIRSTVHPYATDYYWLENTGPSVLTFDGTTQAQLLPASPYSGETCWWSGAVHYSHTTLDRIVDLSALAKATLVYWTWYDVGEDSTVHLAASDDGGQTWTVLETYKGRSEGWVEQRVDLTAYAGAQVRLRFEQRTLAGNDSNGFLLDDLAVPELGLEDACEETGDWRAEGFVLSGPVVPVRWVVQVIDVYREGYPRLVYRMAMDQQQTGQLEVDFRLLGGLLGNRGRGILAVSALARGTTEPLPYRCRIVRQ